MPDGIDGLFPSPLMPPHWQPDNSLFAKQLLHLCHSLWGLAHHFFG
jgi:hypothetical protein